MFLRILIAFIGIMMLGTTFRGSGHYAWKTLKTLIWIAVVIFALFPDLAHRASSLFGVGDNLNTLIFIGFVVVFVLFLHIFQSLENIRKQITGIVRTNALENLPTDKKDSPKT